VIVTAGAGDRESHRAAREHVDPVVDYVVRIVEKPPTDSEKAHRRERVLFALDWQAVGRDLADQEFIIRQVAVQSLNHPVAIFVRVGIVPIFGEEVTLAVGIARNVEPMPGPALAIVRRFQELFQSAIKRDLVAGQSLDTGSRRGQARHVEAAAAISRAEVRRRGWRQTGGFELREDKEVDGRLRPCAVLHGRQRGLHDRLEGPVRA
jgi:hypothetical protein